MRCLRGIRHRFISLDAIRQLLRILHAYDSSAGVKDVD